jgi:putative component of toxin-antitoxin plasmid stabilization module
MSSIQIEIYQTIDGKQLFTEWLHNLKDKKTGVQVRARINRIRDGNF